MKRLTTPSAKPMRPAYSNLDKRNTERLAISCKIQFKGEVPSQPHSGQGVTLDISVSGCKIISEHPVIRGTLLGLTINLPDGEAPLRLTETHVVWVSGCQFSVRFMQVSTAQRKRLQSFIWKHISHTTVHNQRPRFRLV